MILKVVKFCKIGYSFIINLFYWLFHIHKISDTILEVKRLKKRIISIKDIEEVISNFIWTKDKFIDWYPWVITIVNNKLSDDCDGAAYFGKWLLSLVKIESETFRLVGKNSSHLVCISKTKKVMISNNRVILLDPFDWKNQVLNFFEGKYDIVQKF